MIITQSEIDQRVTDYVLTNNGRKPRFILMDEETRKNFNKICYAKERIVLTDGTILDPERKMSDVITLWTSMGGQLNILSVKTESDFFEIVG